MIDNRKTLKEQLEALRPYIIIRNPDEVVKPKRKPRVKKEKTNDA